MADLLSELEAVPVVAYAWRKEGMNGWALGHNPPTPNMLDFDKYEVRELTFRTHHAEIAAAVRDAAYGRALRVAMECEYQAAKESRKGGKQEAWITTYCLLRRLKVAADHLVDAGTRADDAEFSMLFGSCKVVGPKVDVLHIAKIIGEPDDTAMRAGEGDG